MNTDRYLQNIHLRKIVIENKKDPFPGLFYLLAFTVLTDMLVTVFAVGLLEAVAR